MSGEYGLQLVGESRGVLLPVFLVSSTITSLVDSAANSGTTHGLYDAGRVTKWAVLAADTDLALQVTGVALDGAGPLLEAGEAGMMAFRSARAVRGAEEAVSLERGLVRCLEEGQCFAAGTPVWIANPKDKQHPGLGADPSTIHLIAIERVRQGDWAVSREVKTGKLVFRRVTGTSVRSSKDALQLQFADVRTGKVSLVLVATLNHPFFVSGTGWVNAEKLGIGTQIVTRAGPQGPQTAHLVLRKVARVYAPAGIAVYNFTVEGTHSYFVGNALGGVWVHNGNGSYKWQMGKTNVAHISSDLNKGKAQAQSILEKEFDHTNFVDTTEMTSAEASAETLKRKHYHWDDKIDPDTGLLKDHSGNHATQRHLQIHDENGKIWRIYYGPKLP